MTLISNFRFIIINCFFKYLVTVEFNLKRKYFKTILQYNKLKLDHSDLQINVNIKKKKLSWKMLKIVSVGVFRSMYS